jgi:polyisoprenoid-binding protein YceI
VSTATATVVPTGTYSVDPSHSRVEFSAKHLGIATVRGNFGSFVGTLELADDLSSARAHGTVDVASLDTQEPQRDDHLRSPDFFHAERHPQIEFTSTEIRPVDNERFEIVGDLTLRGVTREVVLTAEIQGTEIDPWGNERVALEVRGQLNRSDYGMTFNQVLGSGNVLVSDKVRLALDVSAVKQG